MFFFLLCSLLGKIMASITTWIVTTWTWTGRYRLLCCGRPHPSRHCYHWWNLQPCITANSLHNAIYKEIQPFFPSLSRHWVDWFHQIYFYLLNVRKMQHLRKYFWFCSWIDLHILNQSKFISGTRNPSPPWVVWWLDIPIVFILADNLWDRWRNVVNQHIRGFQICEGFFQCFKSIVNFVCVKFRLWRK